MRNNIFLGLLFAVLSAFSDSAGRRSDTYKSSNEDRAVLRLLQLRHLYLPQGTEKAINECFLMALTDELQGDIHARINHLKVHGLRHGSTRAAVMSMAKQYLTARPASV